MSVIEAEEPFLEGSRGRPVSTLRLPLIPVHRGCCRIVLMVQQVPAHQNLSAQLSIFEMVRNL